MQDFAGGLRRCGGGYWALDKWLVVKLQNSRAAVEEEEEEEAAITRATGRARVGM